MKAHTTTPLPKRLRAILTTLIFCLCLSLLLGHYIVAQTSTSPRVQTQIQNLQSKDDETRLQAIESLATLGAEAEAAVPALIAALKDDSYLVPLQAMDALGTIAKVSPPTVMKLKAALRDRDPAVRVGAAYALAVARVEAKAAVPVLLAELGVGQERAAAGLGLFGAEAKSVVPQLFAYLEKSLNGVDEETRISNSFADVTRLLGEVDSALVMIAMDSREVFPTAIVALTHKDPWLRSTAARMLGAAGAGASATIPQLIPVLRDRSYASDAAATALADIAEDLQQTRQSRADRLKTIANLEKALRVLNNPAYTFDAQKKRVARSLAILKAK